MRNSVDKSEHVLRTHWLLRAVLGTAVVFVIAIFLVGLGGLALRDETPPDSDRSSTLVGTAAGALWVLFLGGFWLSVIFGAGLHIRHDGFQAKFLPWDKGATYAWSDIGPAKACRPIVYGAVVFDGEPLNRSRACWIFMGTKKNSQRLFGADNVLAAMYFGSAQRIADTLNAWRASHSV